MVNASGIVTFTSVLSNEVNFLLTPPPTSVAVSNSAVPGSTPVGTPVRYRIVVSNTGGATITSLTLVDTISPVVTGATGFEPGGFATPVVTSVASGTRYVWTASPVSLAPGAAYTFTISGTVGTATVGSVVSNTAWVSVASTCAIVPANSGVVSFTVVPTPPPAYGSVTLTGGPAIVAPGDTLTHTIAWSVTAAGALSSVVIFDTLPAYTQFVAGTGTPVPDPGWDPSVGPPSQLRWTIPGPFAATASGTITYQTSVDWGNGEAFEPGSGDVAAPDGTLLTNRAALSWAGAPAGAQPGASSTLLVDWFDFTKSATGDGSGELVYTVSLRNRSTLKTWWSVSLWDTVPSNMTAWGPGHGFDDPCLGWTMTPSGCAPYAPGRSVAAGRTILHWALDLAPGASTTLAWRAGLLPSVLSCTTVDNTAAIKASGRTFIVDGTGSSGVPALAMSSTLLCPAAPPSAPAAVTATGRPERVDLEWLPAVAGTSPINGYEIWRATCSGCADSLLITVGSTVTTYQDGTGIGAIFCYRVRAVDSLGSAGPFAGPGCAAAVSPTCTVVKTQTPASPAPGELTTYQLVVANPSDVPLWLRLYDTIPAEFVVTSFDIPAGPFTYKGSYPSPVSGTIYEWFNGYGDAGGVWTMTITGYAPVTPGAWCNQALLKKENGPGPGAEVGIELSNMVCFTTTITGPGTPLALTALGVTGAINLQWDPATPGTFAISAYEVWRGACPVCTMSLYATSTATMFVDAAVIPNHYYAYMVRAGDTWGNFGGFSQTATAATPPTACPALALSVTTFVSPAQPLIDQPITFTIVVTNTGAATITSLTIVDTITTDDYLMRGPAKPVGQYTTDQPAPFGSPWIGNGVTAFNCGPGSTVFVWSSAVTLPPGATMTFTITGTVLEAYSPTPFPTLGATTPAPPGFPVNPMAIANIASAVGMNACFATDFQQDGPGMGCAGMITTLAPAGTYRIAAPPSHFTTEDFWVTVVVLDVAGTTRADYCGTTSFTSTDPLALINGVPMGSFTFAWSSSLACSSPPDEDGITGFWIRLPSAHSSDFLNLRDAGTPVTLGGQSIAQGIPLVTWETATPSVAKAGDLVEYRISFSNESNVSGWSVMITTSDGSFSNRVKTGAIPGAVFVTGGAGAITSLWANSLGGPWNATAPTGQTDPLYLRWILAHVGGHQSGYIRYQAQVLPGPCQLLPASFSATLSSGFPDFVTYGPFTASVTGSQSCPPAAPATLTAIGSAPGITLGWSPATPGTYAISAYEIWRGTCSTCSRSMVTSVPDPGLGYLDAGAVPGQRYYYAVRAVDVMSSTGGFSPPADAVVPQVAPPAPMSLTATPGPESVALNWDEAYPCGCVISAYEVWRATCGGCPKTLLIVVGPSVTIYIDLFLNAGQTYEYTVRGINTDGTTGAFSPDGTAVAGAPALTINLSKQLLPANPVQGGPAAYRLVVRNTGSIPVDTLTVWDTVPSTLTAVTAAAPPAFGAPAVGQATPSGTLYRWSASGLGLPPGGTLTFTITGTVGWVAAPGTWCNVASADGSNGPAADHADSNSACFTETPAAELTASAACSATLVAVGQWCTITLTVTNTGTGRCHGISVSCSALLGSGALATTLFELVSAPAISATVALDPGQSLTCVWTFSCSATAVVSFSSTATAVETWSSLPIACRPGACFLTAACSGALQARPSCSLTVVSGRCHKGHCCHLRCHVINLGEYACDAATATLYISGDVFIVTNLIGPVPTGPVRLDPGASTDLDWTLTPSADGDLCFTVSVTGGGLFSAAVSGGSTLCVGVTDAPAFVLSKQAVGGGAVGAPLTWRLVLDNTGGVTFTDVTVTDTVAPVAVITGSAQPGGFAAPAVASVPGSGTLYTWVGTGLAFRPGTTLTFTLTGAVGTVCASTAVGNTAWAGAADIGDPDGAFSTASNGVGFVVAAPVPDLAVLTIQVPANPGIGEPVQYRILVTNTGAATLDALAVTDTVSPLIVSQAATFPAGMGQSVSGVATGTRYVWSGAALNFQPGTSLTITVTGVIGTVCVPTPLSNTAFADGGSACAGITRGAAAVGSVVLPAATGLTLTDTQAPAAPGSGAGVTYTLVVTNTGAATLTGVTVTDTVSPAVTGVIPTTPAGFNAPVVTSVAGTGTRYAWTATAPLLPGASATFQLAGTAGSVCVSTPVGNNSYVAGAGTCTAVSAAGAAAGFTLAGPALGYTAVVDQAPATPVAGGTVTYRIIVTNTGAVMLTDLLVVDTLPALVTGITSRQPAPFGAPAVAAVAGGSRYVWTAGGLAIGPGMSLTFTVAGTVAAVTADTMLANAAQVTAGNGCASVPVASNVVAASLKAPVSPPEPVDAGKVKIVGGIRGYINPKKGETATMLVRPTGPGEIHIRIYDQDGVLIWQVTQSTSGGHADVVQWRGVDSAGAQVPPGLYPIIIEAPGIRYRDTLVVVR